MAVRLGAAARDLREARGDITLMDIANRAGVGQTAIHNFELGRGWRRQTDEIVAAYARELGMKPEAIWQAALNRSE